MAATPARNSNTQQANNPETRSHPHNAYPKQFNTLSIDPGPTTADKLYQRPSQKTPPSRIPKTIENPILTKIIATIGSPGTPSATPEMLTKLAQAGASVFRLNFSHGKLDEHAQTLAIIRQVEKDLGRPLGVLGDLSGPKIRVGEVAKPGINVDIGEDVIFQKEAIIADGPRFSTTLPQLVDDIKIGEKLLINDGAIRMLVVNKSPEQGNITCRVTVGGLITTRKGINLPNTDLAVDAITEKDWRCVDWAVKHNLDFLALSFVRKPDEVIRLKERVTELRAAQNQRTIPIIAKIEKPEALDNIHAILNAVDAIMVARGDLGVEMDLAAVPIIQKRLIDLARKFAKPTIVATQMLESMIQSATPTRAEASDVANAILDDAGAIMLSGETAIGDYPDLAVDTMRRIAQCTETYDPDRPALQNTDHCRLKTNHWTDNLAAGACQVVKDVGAKLIVAWSQSGRAAMYLSETRFPVPIIACSDELETARRITLLRGVIPVHRPCPDSLNDFTQEIENRILINDWAQPGDPIIIIAGSPIGLAGTTNSLTVHLLKKP